MVRILARTCAYTAGALVILTTSAWGTLALFYGSGSGLTETLRSLLTVWFGLTGIAAAIVVSIRAIWRSVGRFC